MEKKPPFQPRLFDEALGWAGSASRTRGPSAGRARLDRAVDWPGAAQGGARFGGRLKALVSGGAPLNPEIGMFFHALGLPILQGYGQTEAGPVVSVNRPVQVKLHTVGPPLTACRGEIAEDGEILVRGDLVMKGYWNDPEATA